MNNITLILVTLPAVVAASSVVLTIWMGRPYIPPILTAVVFFFLTYIAFNPSFLVWVLIYTMLSVLTSVLSYMIKGWLLKRNPDKNPTSK